MLFFFACTLFVSASLLFLVQPMIAKMVLPKLGGTPAVWNTCMVFFQAALLMGYAYAHSTWQSRRRQIWTHIVILALPFLALPFALGEWNPPADYNPMLSVFWLLLGMVGLPFFVVAASAPLLQRWFSTTGHPAAKDPYFLYGASNLGSMLALLAYPVLVEPNFPVDSQTFLWTAGYGLLAIMVAVCGFMVLQTKEPVVLVPALVETGLARPLPAPQMATPITAPRRLGRQRVVSATLARSPITPPIKKQVNIAQGDVTWLRRLRWMGLAAAPTSLMLGVTTYLTTDIAAMPFIWIVPLALYLLTFILVFARWPMPWVGVPHTVVLYAQPVVLLFMFLTIYAHLSFSIGVIFFIHLLMFFMIALLCHGELAKDRPAARHLTDFFLCMSFGGMLGGMFNALVAPLFFKYGITEFYLAIVLACCLRPIEVGATPLIPGDSTDEKPTPVGWVLNFIIPAVMAFIGYKLASFDYFSNHEFAQTRNWWLPFLYRMAVGLVLVVVLVPALEGRPLRFGLCLGLMILGYDLFARSKDSLIFEDRSFFGFVKVRAEPNHSGTRMYHTLIHGGINHGVQIVEPKQNRRDTITYFHPTGGIGQVFQKFSWPDARLPASLVGLGTVPGGLLAGIHSEPSFAVVGLGTGILAAHAKPGQHVVFYEIDPLVKRLSVPPEGEKPFFYYIQDAVERGANVEIVLGDGRLTMQKDPQPNPYDPKNHRKMEHYFHIIVMDAFSSDAIPMHLLTAEAIDLYLDLLVDGGVLVFNVTNRWVDLAPELGKIAQERGLTCIYYGDFSREVFVDENGNRKEGEEIQDKYSSDWVLLQRQSIYPGIGASAVGLTASPLAGGSFGALAELIHGSTRKNSMVNEGRAFNGGRPLEERLNMKLWEPTDVEKGPMWTDNYSNLLRSLYLRRSVPD